MITPIVTSINEPIIKEQKIDNEKLEDIIIKNMRFRNERIPLDWKFPCICTLLLLIFLPIYIYYNFWYSIGITPLITGYITYITFTIGSDFYDCYRVDWFAD